MQDPDCEELPKKKSLLDDIFDDEIIIGKEEPPLPPLERAKRKSPGEIPGGNHSIQTAARREYEKKTSTFLERKSR